MTKYEPFWKRSSQGTSAGVSVVVHTLLITLSIVATLPAPGVPEGSLANRVYYIPPPNSVPASRGSPEKLHYVELAPQGAGAGLGAAATQADRPATRAANDDTGDSGRDTVESTAMQETVGQDSVFTNVDVDTVAVRLPESAAPRYPQEMLEKRIQGAVIVQFVVDTTGLADVGSLQIVLATRQEFAESIREALPGMRFAAARIGAQKVRQLVELPFQFHIAEPLPAVETKAARRRPP